MKRTAWMIALCVGVLLALTIGVLAQGPVNLLENPGFEGVALPQDNIGQLQVVSGWRVAWKEQQLQKPDWSLGGSDAQSIRRPETKPLPVSVDARRVHEGTQSFLMFGFYSTLLATVQQTVDVPVGTWLQASVYAQSWASENNDPTTNYKSDMYATVGIDPYGEENPWARRIIWSNWAFVPPSGSGEGNWALVQSIPVMALRDRVTVFFLADGRWASRHVDIYFDDATLVEIPAPGEGEAQPTATPQPTYTPAPTYTPFPTLTPYPTYTPGSGTPCPTPTGGTPEPGACPSIAEIRTAIREEVSNLIWGVIGGK